MLRHLYVLSLVFFVACGSEGGDDDGEGGGDSDAVDVTPISGNDKAGDGKCGASETPANSPEDCPAISGDGFCSATETAVNAPNDCPAVAGDGVCTGAENAASSPADCPAVAGDGFCSASETYSTAPSDCPPPSYTFTSGTVATLTNISPKLVFDVLTIDGKLQLQEPAGLSLEARQIVITANGMIQGVWSTCSYADAGDVDLSASESITVNGMILIGGKGGDSQTLSSTCQNCNGADGGNLTLSAPNIAVNNRVDVSGGWSSRIVDQVNNKVVYIGCDGADSGNLILDATVSLTMQATLDLDWGHGGSGSATNGDDGARGAVICTHLGPQMREETGLNGDLDNADYIPISPMSLRGHVSESENSSEVATGTTRYWGGTDRIEDLFVGTFKGSKAQTFRVTLTGTSGTGDIDLYILNAAGVDLYQANTPTNSEVITFTAQPNTLYYFAVNASADASTSMDYTLAISNSASF